MRPDPIGPDELVLREGHARSFRRVHPQWEAYTFAHGRIVLTDRRVLWERTWLGSIPFVGPRSLEIPLQEIRDCAVRGSGLALTMGWGAGGLAGTSDSGEHMFLISEVLWYSEDECNAWCDAILRAVETPTLNNVAQTSSANHQNS